MQKKTSKIVFASCHFHGMIFQVDQFHEIIIQFEINDCLYSIIAWRAAFAL